MLAESITRLFECSQEERSADLFNEALLQLSALSAPQSAMQPRVINAEMCITAAEAAFSLQLYPQCENILKEYLKQPRFQYDQLYCRANILQSRLCALQAVGKRGEERISVVKESLKHVLTAIDIATQPANAKLYAFIVFNSSLHAWEALHMLLDPTHARFVTAEVLRVSAALELVADPDIEWRVQYLVTASYCLFYDENIKASSDCMDKGLALLEEVVQKRSNAEAELLAKLSALIDDAEKTRLCIGKGEEALSALCTELAKSPSSEESSRVVSLLKEEEAKLSELQTRLVQTQSDKNDAESEVASVRLALAALRGRLVACYMQRVHVHSADAKRFIGAASIVNNVYFNVSVQIQCAYSGITPEKDMASHLASIASAVDAAAAKKKASATVLAECYLDVARAAIRSGLTDVAKINFSKASNESDLDTRAKVKLELYKAMVAAAAAVSPIEVSPDSSITRLTHAQVYATASSNKLDAIKSLERLLAVSLTQVKDIALSVEICTAIWTASIPFLKPGTRHLVYRALVAVAQYLDMIDCKLLYFRAQLYLEIAIYEESADFLSSALEITEKALALDYGNANKTGSDDDSYSPFSRLRPLDRFIVPLHISLVARVDIYGDHDSPEEKAVKYLQQFRETKIKSIQMDLIEKALALFVHDIGMSQYFVENASQTLDIKKKKLVRVSHFKFIDSADIEKVVDIDHTHANSKPSQLDATVDMRFRIMSSILQHAQSLGLVQAIQLVCVYLLSATWSVSDEYAHEYLHMQIEAYYLLAESFVERLNTLDSTSIDSKNKKSASLDYRALGLEFADATDDVTRMKTIILSALLRGIDMAMAINDYSLVHNGMVYFWNLHLHIFRLNNYKDVLPKVYSTVKNIVAVFMKVRGILQTDPSFLFSSNDCICNDDMRGNMYEVLCHLHEAQSQVPAAVELATKGCSVGSIYSRKRLCEYLCKLQFKQASIPKAKPYEAPKFDSPFLIIFGYLAIAEERTSREVALSFMAKAFTCLTTDAASFTNAVKWDKVDHSYFEELIEMQIECWTRLARMYLLYGNVIGAQEAAEAAVKVMEGSIVVAPFAKAFRWLSLAEQYFGLALFRFLGPQESDEGLRLELCLAALRRLIKSCDHGLKSQECRLVVSAASAAWSVCLSLSKEHFSDAVLIGLLKDIVVVLVKSSKQAMTEKMLSTANTLIQSMYVTIIEAMVAKKEYAHGLEMIESALAVLPISLQKPVIKWKIYILNTKGIKVAGLMQKLKENDPLLQSSIYALVARSATDKIQMLEFYSNVLESLQEPNSALLPYRLEYILEIAQAMAASGAATTAVFDILHDIESMKDTHESKITPFLLYSSRINPKIDCTLQTYQLIDVCIRTSLFKGSVATHHEERSTHYFDAFEYMERGLQCANSTMALSHKLKDEAQLTANAHSIEDYLNCADAPAELQIPAGTLERLVWVPSSAFQTARDSLGEYCSYFPSHTLCEGFKATFLYTMRAINFILENGHTKQSLVTLSFLRVMLRCMSASPSDQYEVDVQLCCTHFKVMRILLTSGLHNEAKSFSSNSSNHVYLRVIVSIPNGSLSDTLRNEQISMFPPQMNSDGNFEIVAEDGNSRASSILGLLQQTAVDIALCGDYELARVLLASLADTSDEINDSSISFACQVSLANIDYMQGRFSYALVRVLQCYDRSKASFDVESSALAVKVLVGSYLQLNRLDEAVAVARSMFQIMLSRVASHKASGGESSLPNDALYALASIAESYLSALTGAALGQLSSESAVEASFKEMLSIVDRVEVCVVKSCGELSMLSAVFHENVFRILHKLTQAIPSSLPAASKSFVVTCIQSNITNLESARDVCLHHQRSFEDKWLQFDSSLVQLFSEADIMLSRVLLTLSLEYTRLSHLIEETHFVSLRPIDLVSLNPIDKYMVSSKPTKLFSIEDFEPLFIFKASRDVEICMQLAPYLQCESCTILNSVCIAQLYATELSVYLWDPAYEDPQSALKPYIDRLKMCAGNLEKSIHQTIGAQHYEIAALGCEQLFLAYGSIDPVNAMIWLLKYQSIRAREYLSAVAVESLPLNSPLAALWHRVDLNAASYTPSNALSTGYAAAEEKLLQSCCAMRRRLHVRLNPLDIFKSIPKSTNFLCLQFNEFQTFLYGSFGKITAGAAISISDCIVDRVQFTEAQRLGLQQLIQRHAKWVNEVMKFIVDGGSGLSAEEDYDSKDAPLLSSVLEELESSLQRTVTELNALFASLVGPSSRLYQAAQVCAGDSGNPLVLLFDACLHSLPLESLALAQLFEGASSRDYSIDMYGNRMLDSTAVGEDLQLRMDNPVALASAVKYVVDPFHDDVKDIKSYESMSKAFHSLKHSRGSKWASIGKENSMSICTNEWLHVLDNSKAKGNTVFVHLPGRLSSALRLRELSLFNMENVVLAVIVDRGHSDKSYRRQLMLHNERDVSEVLLDSHLSALLSLAGCQSIVVSQWSTSFATQRRFITRFWEALFSNHSVTSALRYGNSVEPIPSKREVEDSSKPSAGKAATVKATTKKQEAVEILKTASISAADQIVDYPTLKNWVRYSRVSYGIASTTYSDS